MKVIFFEKLKGWRISQTIKTLKFKAKKELGVRWGDKKKDDYIILYQIIVLQNADFTNSINAGYCLTNKLKTWIHFHDTK